MKIRVREDHIRRGCPRSPENCAIAEAIREQVRALTYVAVCGDVVQYAFDRFGVQAVAELPPAARKFVADFDDDLFAVGAFEFELALEYPVLAV